MTSLMKIWLLFLKTIEIAAGKVARITPKQKEKHYTEYAGECQITRGSCCKVHEKDQEESAQETSQESKG